MAYNKFTLESVVEKFDIKLTEWKDPLHGIEPYAPSRLLKEVLQEYMPLGIRIGTEKARSEFIIAPILAEIRKISKEKVSIFSGRPFTVDAKRGLNGFCDFLISQDPEQRIMKFPVVAIVEAKKDDLMGGIGQCTAEMYAADIFNKKKNKPRKCIYGAVTMGDAWLFLKLEDNVLHAQDTPITIDRIEMILGMMLKMVLE